MFPSQPQIGQDMARERQQLAARMRLAQEARPATTPRRWRALGATIRTVANRSLSALARPLRSFERGVG
jgi:hypothetical protein